MKHITRLAVTDDIKGMLEALKKSFADNPKFKFEIDFDSAKVIRVSKEGYNRPLFMALCKDNDTWVTSYPEDLWV